MGQSLLNFVVTLIALGAIGAIFFVGLDRFAKDETFKKVAKIAVGAAVVIVGTLAASSTLFGVGTMPAASPSSIVELAIGVIVAFVVLEILYRLIEWGWPTVLPFKDLAVLIVGAVAVGALLVLVERALFGGGLGLLNLTAVTLK